MIAVATAQAAHAAWLDAVIPKGANEISFDPSWYLDTFGFNQDAKKIKPKSILIRRPLGDCPSMTENSLKCALQTVTQTCNVSNLNLGITNPGQIDSCCYQLDCKNGGTIDYLGVCYCRCTPPFAGKECERRFSQVLCLAILATSNILYMQGLTSESIGR